MDVKDIKISDYTYDLPEDKIAFFPLAQRDASRLLVYENGEISEDKFSNIVSHFPDKSLLVFNNSKVINARLQFTKPSGGIIEIFLLEPVVEDNYDNGLSQNEMVTWNCFVGGAAKWKTGKLELDIEINDLPVKVFAEKISRGEESYQVKFSWNLAQYSFAEIIEKAGAVPLPPYIKRAVATEDEKRYQTIYAAAPGSVAAPTAGLHFTKTILEDAAHKNIDTCAVTLHVGAGTFKPVKADTMEGHHMHAELLEITIPQIEHLQQAAQIIAVGTTSLRTLETIYHMGARILRGEKDLQIKQWDVYTKSGKGNFTREEVLQALKTYLESTPGEKIILKTEILIAPGYQIKMADYLVTNFHQPQSTLLLLVAAAVGETWQDIYNYALQNNFRFLSYGDTSLLKIENTQG